MLCEMHVRAMICVYVIWYVELSVLLTSHYILHITFNITLHITYYAFNITLHITYYILTLQALSVL